MLPLVDTELDPTDDRLKQLLLARHAQFVFADYFQQIVEWQFVKLVQIDNGHEIVANVDVSRVQQIVTKQTLGERS